MLDTLNWLTITTPFIAAFTVYRWGGDAGDGRFVPALLGSLAFVGLIAIWYILFLIVEFPWWIRNFVA